MDFADSPEHAAFRSEIRRWLETNLPSEICVDDATDQRVAPDREPLEKRIQWQKTMHAAGWVGLSWPKEYGGRGANFMQQVIFDEEYTRARAPILPGGERPQPARPEPDSLGHGRAEAAPPAAHPQTPTSSGARAFPSPTPAAIWRACAPARSTTETISSSTARRCGPRVRISPIGAFSWCAPTPRRPSTTASAICSST